MFTLGWMFLAFVLDEEMPRFKIEREKIDLHRNSRTICYRLEYLGSEPFFVSPDNIDINYRGEDLANSRLASHSYPRSSSAHFLANTKRGVPVIKNCQEILTAEIRSEQAGPKIKEEIALNHGDCLWLILTIEHHHLLQHYDALGGKRIFEFLIGENLLRDEFFAVPDDGGRKEKARLSEIPPERRDLESHRPRQPLFLCTNVAGLQFFRFDDIPVPPNSPWQISFRYFVAAGSDGDCYFRLSQYQDEPHQWIKLASGFDLPLEILGSWQTLTRKFTTSYETTTIAFDFRLVGSSAAAVWIDDIKIEPQGPPSPSEP